MDDIATTRLSSKGQVVIPEAIRKRLGLEPGTEFVVLGENDTVVPQADRRAVDARVRRDHRPCRSRRARSRAPPVGHRRSDPRRAVRVRVVVGAAAYGAGVLRSG